MPASQNNSYKDDRVTLPPIRDILREELNSSPKSSSRALGSSFAGSMRSALPDYTSPRASASQLSQEHYAQRTSHGRAWEHHPTSRNTPPPSAPSYAYSSHSAAHATRRPVPEEYHASAHSSAQLQHSRSHAEAYRSPPTAHGHLSAANWDKHRRRESTDVAWSAHPSSSALAPQHAPQHANALHFQPLPHAATAGHYSRHSGAPSSSVRPGSSSGPVDYQSPFGVLIADVDPQSVAPADPQRMAILRTLKASGQQGSFPLNFDDPRNSIQTARYQCEYCLKRFTRPSSLKIHIHSHTGEKPYECTFEGCNRRFSVQSNMRRHARVHEGGARKGDSSGDEAEEASPQASPQLKPL